MKSEFGKKQWEVLSPPVHVFRVSKAYFKIKIMIKVGLS